MVSKLGLFTYIVKSIHHSVGRHQLFHAVGVITSDKAQ
jgi:hypothetical protein